MRLCEIHDRLPRPLPVAMPAARLVEICDDKTALLEVAERVGVPYPAWDIVPDASHLTAAAARIGFPCVVKPAMAERRLFGEKALILRDPAALQARLPAWPEDGGELLVQRYVEGLRHNLHLVAKDGKLLRCLDTVSLRTQRLNGSGLTVSSVSAPTPPADARVVRKAARSDRLHRIGCLQFLDDQRRGDVAFLELNPRMAAGSGIAPFCGLDLPKHALALALGLPGRAGICLDAYRMGARYAWTEGDLAGLATTLRQREIGVGDALAWLVARSRRVLGRHPRRVGLGRHGPDPGDLPSADRAGPRVRHTADRAIGAQFDLEATSATAPRDYRARPWLDGNWPSVQWHHVSKATSVLE